VSVTLTVRNTSSVKGCYQTGDLRRLAARVCAGEAIDGGIELSVLLCDDPHIRALNRAYRHVDKLTDVLSFPQALAGIESRGTRPRCLGDVAISCETVARRRGGDPAATRAEVRLLFCHGLLHLLGYDHAAAADRRRMAEKQALYLGVPLDAAWIGPRRRARHINGAEAIGRRE
jgi:probable rRNA maturation factor